MTNTSNNNQSKNNESGNNQSGTTPELIEWLAEQDANYSSYLKNSYLKNSYLKNSYLKNSYLKNVSGKLCYQGFPLISPDLLQTLFSIHYSANKSSNFDNTKQSGEPQLGSLKIVDCRHKLSAPGNQDPALLNWGRKAFADQHIPGAIYWHLEDDLSGEVIPSKTGRHPLPTKESWSKLLNKYNFQKNDVVIVYDQDSSPFASRAWWMLKASGFRYVFVLDGGFESWNKCGRITETSSPATINSEIIEDYTTTTNSYDFDPSIIVTSDQIQQGFPNNHVLIDSRSRERYLGLSEPIDPIAGHIPGAINHDFTTNNLPDGKFKSPTSLKDCFDNLTNKGFTDKGYTDKESVKVFYCGSGVTACQNILATQIAGLDFPKLYPGSWSEWITDPSRDISNNS